MAMTMVNEFITPEKASLILLKNTGNRNVRNDDIGRIQYALKKYITGSCTKKTIVPKKLIYPYPYEDGVAL